MSLCVDSSGWSQLGGSYAGLGKTHFWLFVELEGQLGQADLQWAHLELLGSLRPLSSNGAQAPSHFLSVCLHNVCLGHTGQSELQSQSRVRTGERVPKPTERVCMQSEEGRNQDFSPRYHKEPLLMLLFICVCFLSLCPSCLLSSPLPLSVFLFLLLFFKYLLSI